MIDRKNMTALIVDDMENMCKSMRAMMKVIGYGKTFYFAHNGAEAYNLLKKTPIDLAIVDWNMPVMTGVELLARIREDRELRDIPVVMVTAEGNREIVAEVAESEIDSYILKPFSVKSLGDRISMVIEKANNPPPSVCYLKRARDFKEAGNYDAAIEEVRQAMETDPLSSRPVRELGCLFFKKGDLKRAEAWLAKAARMNQQDVTAFHSLGELYLRQNDIEKAAKCFDKAMRISPRHVSRGIYFGQILVQKNMIKKAISVFDKAITLSGNSLAMREEIAEFCLQNRAYDYAIGLLEGILGDVPSRSDIMVRLATVYEKLGKNHNALDYLIEAGKKDSGNIETKILTAKLYIKIEHLLRAEQVLKSILKLDSENETASSLLRQII
jgi:DNA-binding response OmpR family regulator